MAEPYAHTYEQYDRDLGAFVPSDLRVVSVLDCREPFAPQLGEKVFCDVGLYDIDATVVRALRNLRQRFPICYARVFNTAKGLRSILGADTGVGLIYEAVIYPSPVEPSPAKLGKMLQTALETGCSGAVVDSIPVELEKDYPEALFLRRGWGDH